MSYFDTIMIALVEGLTEFLPISSTGHMIVVADLLHVSQDQLVTSFEVIIQVAAIVAVVVYYRREMTQIVQLWRQLLIAFLPIAVIGFAGAKFFQKLFTVRIVAIMFIVGGIIFLLVEWWYGKKHHSHNEDGSLQSLTDRQALWIGVAQIFALVPGTSRAGATIIGGMLAGLTRAQATTFSFFVALPVLGAAAFYEIVRHYDTIRTEALGVFFVGFVVAFLVAYGTIAFLVRFVARHRLVAFGIYRILFGILLLLFFI